MSNDILNAVQEYMINGHVSDAPFIINDYVITLERLDNGVRISATRGGQTESVVVYDGDLTNLNHEVLANRSASDQHPINAISGLRSELDSKQGVISDLEQIRTNAGKGATAVQHNELSNVAMTGSYNDLNGKPNLARVATSGSYNDLVDKPSMVLDHNNLTGRSGYNQHPMSSITGLIDNLNGKQGVISDLSEIRANARKADTAVQPSDLARVATTGSYNDLTDKPIGVSDVQVNGTSVVADGVANVPIANTTTYGAIKFNPNWGIDHNEGRPVIYGATNSDIDERSSRYYPITPKYLPYAVKSAMTAPESTDDPAWTAAEQAAARERIGAADIDDVNEIKDDISDLQTRVTAIEDMDGLHRYGVTGIGLANTQLTRLYDAVGMTAQVGTDGDNSNVINNFDDVSPFNRRKCVGEWRLYEGKPVFHVNAYYGDPDYTEDGSMGDYVAVDCAPAYYMYDQENGTLVISAHHYDGYRPFDCLMDRTTGECRPHTYLPCYALATVNGHAVSLPGLRNEQGDYAKLFNLCKTADNDAATQAMLMPIAVNFYEWALFTVEFATTNCQTIMQGCASLRHSNDDLILMSSATEGIIQNHQAARVVGEYVSIQPSNVDINTATWLASHRISSIERCDQDGTPNASGTYNHVTLEVIDDTRTIEAGTTYRFAARPYNTGSCNSVSTPSGSPVSNTNGYYPMKYRWRENVYGNQYQTVVDLMNYAVVEDGFANSNANYSAHLEWYYHRNPETLTPTNYANNSSDRDAMIAAGWELLDISTPAENYINGYVKSREHSHKYPDVWKPGVTTGASTSTYFADYAYLVNSNLLRAVRLGGHWHYGANAGFSTALAFYAPSSGIANFGGGLYYPQ